MNTINYAFIIETFCDSCGDLTDCASTRCWEGLVDLDLEGLDRVCANCLLR